MKTVFITKDAYENSTVRVNYFEKDCVKTYNDFEINEETEELTTIIRELLYNKLLFCQRLEWVNNEDELDSYIEEVRQYWENRINT